MNLRGRKDKSEMSKHVKQPTLWIQFQEIIQVCIVMKSKKV